MASPSSGSSPRKRELLELAYAYALDHGLADISLRPLAAAIGSSPRVLLFLFGSKDDLTRALLARARHDELAMLEAVSRDHPDIDLAGAAARVWEWLSGPQRRPLLTLWAEGYARSLTEPTGPWSGFAERTVRDWLAVLAHFQPPRQRRSAPGEVERTAVLAVLRGALLDLLATGDLARTTTAVHEQLTHITT
ncbi:MAG TPA: TetR/AcrR family transcriptional regulator [Acidimicrobiales bacterium]|nr:TetR/AcrR family transcriptional regulator [Acidimicrobiales bacterium]